MKYFLEPLGCQMNKSDAERIRTVLENMGLERTEKEEEATILGLVSCSVRQKSINRVYGRIDKWNNLKNRKSFFTFLSGCVLEADKINFLKLFDLVFEMNDLPKLPDLIRQYGVTIPINFSNFLDKDDNFWNIKPRYESNFQAFVPIQNGCNKFCSFCAVPYTRGREVSRPSSEIIEEVKELILKGYKSITLLGQNVNSYGHDKPGKEISFSELLMKIGEIGKETKNDFWIYFTSPHPSDMKDDVLEAISKYDCLAKHIHLPIQSGDNEILKRMNRSYNLDKYRSIVKSIRQILPTATLFTDIIVGFSGETKEQFENTIKAVNEFEYDMAYIAQYSPRPGAASYEMPDDVALEEKKLRHHKLTDELKKVTLIRNKQMIGNNYKVLVENEDRKEGYLSGKTEGLIPVRFKENDKSLIGKFVYIKIYSVTPFAAEGERIS